MILVKQSNQRFSKLDVDHKEYH